MSRIFGDKQRFAAEVGDGDDSRVRRVDLWAAGHWLTCVITAFRVWIPF